MKKKDCQRYFNIFHLILGFFLLSLAALTSPAFAIAQIPDWPALPAKGNPIDKQAMSANTFLSSLGVVTHIDQGYNASNYIADMQYTGIRNFRDQLRNLNADINLHQQTGALMDITGGCNVDEVIQAAKTIAQANALLSIEGPNEPNNWPVTYNGQTGGG